MKGPREGKVAVVTGASRGLGLAIASGLAERGAEVASISRSGSSVGVDVRADVSRPEDVDRARRAIESELASPSILVNAAGTYGPIQLVKDSDASRWIEAVMINAVGAYLTCRAFVGGMIEQGWGRIVNVTSAASLHPPGPLNSAYGTSKVALNQFTRHLAAEIAGSGVTANVMHPGDVKTEMWAYIRDEAEKLGPEADAYKDWVRWVDETGGDPPEKAVDLVLRLAQDDAPAVNGQFLWIERPLQAPLPSWGEPVSEQPWRAESGSGR